MTHTPGPYWYNYNSVSKNWRINGAEGYASIGAAYSEANAAFIVRALNAGGIFLDAERGKRRDLSHKQF